MKMQYHTQIGEHLVEILCDDHFVDFISQNFSRVSKMTKPHLTVKVEAGFGVPFVNYDVEIIKSMDHITYRRADYLIEVDPGYREANLIAHDELALKHALVNLYSSFIVHHQWGLLIHSSCVLENGNAHLFAGHSGAGKSTAARLSYPRELFSDEASIVRITSEGAVVYDSPLRSEQQSRGFQNPRPLASVQLLFQAEENQRIRLSKSESLLLLIDKVFYWPHSDYETRRIIQSLKKLVMAVPVYELHFQKNNIFWELIS